MAVRNRVVERVGRRLALAQGVDRCLARLLEGPGLTETGSSTWQSLAKGSGSVETDYLNGEIVLLGQTVNSYGMKLDLPVSFAALLRRIDRVVSYEVAEELVVEPRAGLVAD